MSVVISNTSPELVEPSRPAAYVELTKLRISVMVLITFAIAGLVSAGSEIDWLVLGFALVGMLAISASGNAMNMYLERYSDFLMTRTRERPLPARRLTASEVATFVAVSFGAGATILFAAVNWQTGLCGVLTWLLYVAVYTPLKPRTHWNTEVGAVAGALPVIMGCLATTGTVTLVGWGLFLVLLFWQFPHFMSIAWRHREDYRRGGLKMVTVIDPSGRLAGRKAVRMAVVTALVSLIPAFTFRTEVHGVVFSVIAMVLGGWYLGSSQKFARELTDDAARKLLRTSVIYLPLYMVLLLVTAFV